MPAPETHPIDLLTAFSTGALSAIDVRRALGNITYGELFRLVADANLHLPDSPATGREATLAKAQAWMFPKPGDA